MKFLDLFAGIGGFRLGMEQAGHACVGHCEIDKFANKSYIAMHRPKEDEWYADDITRVRAEDIPRADCWCFGFPCQDISVAGKQQGFRGQRSSLFFAVTKLIRGQEEENKPSYLLIENVKNILSVNRGVDFARLLMELDEIGYDAEWALLNTADVLPQNRERCFIVGHLRGRSTRKVFPIGEEDRVATDKGTGLQDSRCIATALRATDYKGTHNIISYKEPKLDLVALIDGDNKQENRIYGIDGISPALNAVSGGRLEPKVAIPVLTPDRENKRQNGRRFKTDGEPMFTLTSQDRHGVMVFNPDRNGNAYCLDASYNKGILSNQKRTGIYDGCKIRKLTPRECFRLQGFPDDFFDRAREVCSDTQLYKQAGNSVTVPVIYEIAKRMEVLS